MLSRDSPFLSTTSPSSISRNTSSRALKPVRRPHDPSKPSPCLPWDVLHLVVDFLTDFGSLAKVALSCRFLHGSAVKQLYRSVSLGPVMRWGVKPWTTIKQVDRVLDSSSLAGAVRCVSWVGYSKLAADLNSKAVVESEAKRLLQLFTTCDRIEHVYLSNLPLDWLGLGLQSLSVHARAVTLHLDIDLPTLLGVKNGQVGSTLFPLARLSHLRVLKVSSLLDTRLYPQFRTPPLPSLRYLHYHIEVSDPVPPFELVQTFQTSLETLYITLILNPPSRRSPFAVLSALSSAVQGCSLLTDLRIRTREDSPHRDSYPDPSPASILSSFDIDTLRSFLRHLPPSLESLYLSSPCRVTGLWDVFEKAPKHPSLRRVMVYEGVGGEVVEVDVRGEHEGDEARAAHGEARGA
ncbi:hypothetical protein JCM8097_006247 [Rhodosporidiobolus ruineniae]